MKILKYTYILILALAFSCDTIEGDYIEQNAPFISDVYLFEFTGINCPNCPDAHRIISDLQEKFGDKLHVVSIHAGTFALPFTPDQPDFRTEVGDEINNRVNTSKNFPSGAVMTLAEGTSTLATSWSTQLANFGWKRAGVDIEYSAEIINDDVIVNANARLFDDIEGNHKLCLYLVENKIIDFQVDGGSRIENYEHNHVLRASVNGNEGTEIKAGSVFDNTYKMQLNESWNKNNLHIIPFVYNTQTYEVLTANIIHVE